MTRPTATPPPTPAGTATPGPWRAERNAGPHHVYPYRVRRVNEDESVRDIGEVWHKGDAALIAAAPELRDALAEILDTMRALIDQGALRNIAHLPELRGALTDVLDTARTLLARLEDNT